MSKYPKDWKAISRSYIERNGNICQRCGCPGGATIIRLLAYDLKRRCWTKRMTKQWRLWQGEVPQDGNQWSQPIQVVLHCHHVGAAYPDGSPGDRHDKSDCRDANLLALCQRCHLLEDQDIHLAVRRKRYAQRLRSQLEKLGQLRLPGM